jgi:hypothetical protein
MYKKKKLKKYVCVYYGWITGYGDWDIDDFVLMAYDKDEARQKVKERLQTVLTKGEPTVILKSTFDKKMKLIQDNSLIDKDIKKLKTKPNNN